MASLEQAFAALDLKGRIVVVLGPPCSGKGTQCKRLAEKFGLVHLSTGDAFRDLAARATELGLEAKEFLDRGSFVPDDLAIRLIRERLEQDDVDQRGCLLDGFPRTVTQAESLSRSKVDAVVLLEASDKTMLLRAADRRIDPETGNIYHLKFAPPPSDVEHRVIRRDLDDTTSFKSRLDVYRASIRRVLPFFSGKVRRLDAGLEQDDVFNNFVQILAEIDAKIACTAPKALCSICFDQPATCLVIPCGHQCGCEVRNFASTASKITSVASTKVQILKHKPLLGMPASGGANVRALSYVPRANRQFAGAPAAYLRAL